MRILVEHLGETLLAVFVSILCLHMIFSVPMMDEIKEIYPDADKTAMTEDNRFLAEKEKPVLVIEEFVVIETDSEYDYRKYINTASSPDGNADLTDTVKVYYQEEADRRLDTVDTSVTGSREVLFSVEYEGIRTAVRQTVLVKDFEVME